MPTLTHIDTSLREGAVDVALFPRELVDAVAAAAGFDFDEVTGAVVVLVENVEGAPINGVHGRHHQLRALRSDFELSCA